ALEGRFVIDTGSSAAIILSPETTGRESLATAFRCTLGSVGRGVGGELRNQVGRAESFTLGGLEFAKPIVVMPENAAHISAPGSIGNIGGQILARCRVTFDYPRMTVRFERGPEFDKPFEADMSGAAMSRTPEGMV